MVLAYVFFLMNLTSRSFLFKSFFSRLFHSNLPEVLFCRFFFSLSLSLFFLAVVVFVVVGYGKNKVSWAFLDYIFSLRP